MELNQLKQIIWEISEEALCQVACDWHIIKSLILFNYNKIIYSRRSLKLHKRAGNIRDIMVITPVLWNESGMFKTDLRSFGHFTVNQLLTSPANCQLMEGRG